MHLDILCEGLQFSIYERCIYIVTRSASADWLNDVDAVLLYDVNCYVNIVACTHAHPESRVSRTIASYIASN